MGEGIGDALFYYDKKKKKELGMMQINGATLEEAPSEKQSHRILQLRMSHPDWRETKKDGSLGGAVHFVVEFADEDQVCPRPSAALRAKC